MVVGSEPLKRRTYLVALAAVAPLLPVVAWVQRGREPLALPVYGALTVLVVAALVGLATDRLALRQAERLVLLAIPTVLLVRLTVVTYVDPVPLPQLRTLVVETIAPTLLALVLVAFLALEERQARRFAVVLWALFTATWLPRAIAAVGSHTDVLVALGRQSATVAAVAGLAAALASLKTQLALERARARALDDLARTDELTGVSNRRGVEEALSRQVARVDRYGGTLSVALLDLDGFKATNDHHGHAAGDAALVAIVDALGGELRDTDTLGRWGGDELLVVAPETSSIDARTSAERWRRLVADLGLSAGAAHITTSIGVATLVPGEDADALLRRADRALYAAKRGGGDRVVSDRELEAAVTGGPGPEVLGSR